MLARLTPPRAAPGPTGGRYFLEGVELVHGGSAGAGQPVSGQISFVYARGVESCCTYQSYFYATYSAQVTFNATPTVLEYRADCRVRNRWRSMRLGTDGDRAEP